MILENLGLIIVVGFYALWVIGYIFFWFNESLLNDMDNKILDKKYYKPKFFLGLTISLTVWSLFMYWLFG